MNPKINKLKAEKTKNLRKIAEMTVRNEEIDTQVTELENLDIIGMVRDNAITPEMLAEIIKAAKAPNDKQNERIEALEAWQKIVDIKLNSDNERLAAIADDNRITQRALRALLDHGIDGNNIKQMQDAKEDLYMHLTEKK